MRERERERERERDVPMIIMMKTRQGSPFCIAGFPEGNPLAQ